MARNILLFIGALVVGTAHGGEAEKFFSERSKDFGTVPFGPVMVHQFKVTNTSNQTAYITGARVSCGCVAASVGSNTLAPGASTYVTANMDTKRFVGPKEVIVYVSFSRPSEEVTLTVRANRNDNFSQSGETLSLGQVRKGAEGTGTLQVTMRNDAYFELKGAASGTDFVKANFKLLRRDRSEVVYEVAATLRPGLDTGVWTTDVVFTSSNPSLSSVRIPVVVEVVAPITATPAMVQFSAVKVGETKEMSVVVKGDKPFKILDVKGGDGLITAVADGAESKQAHVVRLVFQPNAAGDMTRSITVVTDSGVEAQVIIPVRGKGKSE